MNTDQTTERTAQGPWLGPTEALVYCDPVEAPARESAPAEDDAVRYGFRVGNLGMLVPAKAASELSGDLSVYPVPNTPPWFPGLVNLRGNLIPVFDLKRLLMPGDDSAPQRKLLVLDKEENAAGILVDGFPRPLKLAEPMTRAPSLPGTLEEHLAAAYFVDDAVWLEIWHRELFAAIGQLMAGGAATG